MRPPEDQSQGVRHDRTENTGNRSQLPVTPWFASRRQWRSARSLYYSDIDLVADWDDKEGTFKGFSGTTHRPLKRPASADYFFRSGITYSSRTQLAFSARVLPGNSIFHAKG